MFCVRSMSIYWVVDVDLIEKQFQIERYHRGQISAVKLHNEQHFFFYQLRARFFTFDFSFAFVPMGTSNPNNAKPKPDIIFVFLDRQSLIVALQMTNYFMDSNEYVLFFHFRFESPTRKRSLGRRRRFFFGFSRMKTKTHAFGDQLSIDLISECLICICSRKTK